MKKVLFFLFIPFTILSLNVAAQGVSTIGQFTVGYNKANGTTAAIGVAPLSSQSTIAFSWLNGTLDYNTVNAIKPSTINSQPQNIAIAGKEEIIIPQTICIAETIVCDVSGKIIYRGNARHIPVTSGLYLVNVNGQTVKIIIQ